MSYPSPSEIILKDPARSCTIRAACHSRKPSGRNTTDGVVQIVTKTPSSAPFVDLTFGYGNYNTFTLNF